MAVRERLVAEAMAPLEQEQALFAEHVGARVTEPLVARGRLGREDETVVEERKRLHLGILDRQRHKYDVEIAGYELAYEIGGQRLAELQVEGGKAPMQLGQSRGQEIGRNRRNGAELESARQHPFLMLGVIDEVAH